jgi:hypothetical protein
MNMQAAPRQQFKDGGFDSNYLLLPSMKCKQGGVKKVNISAQDPEFTLDAPLR